MGGTSSHLQQFHLPQSRQRRSTSQAASHTARFGARNSAMEYPPVGPPSRPGSSAGFRPVSAPPKPGYTQTRASTLPTTPSTGVPPYRTTLNSPFGGVDVTDGRVSQASSFASSAMPNPGNADMSYSRTYSQGFQHFQHSTPKQTKAPQTY